MWKCLQILDNPVDFLGEEQLPTAFARKEIEKNAKIVTRTSSHPLSTDMERTNHSMNKEC